MKKISLHEKLNIIFDFIMVAIIIYFIFLLALKNVDAYTISRNKVVKNSTMNIIKTYPNTLTIYKPTIIELNTLHANYGNVAYQSGYDDAVNDMLYILGMKEKQHKTIPVILESSNTRFIFKDLGGYFPLNMSIYKGEYYFNNTFINIKKFNITIDYIKVYTK
jgi:hypothetical protein